ncbi:UPF0149 family protein [Bradyrhizobium sp. STM 3557]|uniref:UPF0149 family protein n=1 Tax=Bradyrhizobium sp. STM 3557 TaxID=578920 RepID=UPI00388DF93F
MSEQIGRWDELEQALLTLDDRAMVLEELDGFIAGLLVCPELIPPGEWFARAVGLTTSRSAPLRDLAHANEVLGLVMDYYNDVALTLARHPERYQPRFPIDDRNGDVIWELWLEGFAAAADLRRDAWGPLLDVGGTTTDAWTTLVLLMDIANGDPDMGAEDEARLRRDPMGAIRTAILALNAHRLSSAPQSSATVFTEQSNPFARMRKVGRNDPCPCGSGKKYKRCCGAN